TGLKGKLVSLADALDGCERILNDEFKDYPESALYMIGTIDEAKAKGKPVAPAAKAGAKNAAGSQEGTGGEFGPLVEQGVLTSAELEEAVRRAQARGLEIEKVLSTDYKVGKQDLLAALAKHYHCLAIEYDERLPIPPELL
ncbi:hypothetical protein QML25_29900, partial [Klebsiella pneumoniae]